MRRIRVALLCAVAMLGGCGKRGFTNLFYKKEQHFVAHVKQGELTVHARLCPHHEIQRYFSCSEDLYHYYYLMHVRLQNRGYVRHTLVADKCSFFVPPALLLKKYTRSDSSTYGGIVSFFTTLLFFPVYAINLLKETVENPYFVASASSDRYIVITPHFAVLTAVYAAFGLGPLIIGVINGKARSNTYYKEATEHILTQHRELSVAPYKTRDTLILTPRAGFIFPPRLAVYNHQSHEYEIVTVPVKPLK